MIQFFFSDSICLILMKSPNNINLLPESGLIYSFLIEITLKVDMC